MKKPENFLQEVWDKLSEQQKKETYLNSIIYSLDAPPYLAGLIEDAEINIDIKITIAEKIIDSRQLTQYEKTLIKYDIVD